MDIVEAKLSDLESFFEYLGTQLLDNAADDFPLFQPMAKKHCVVTEPLKAKFRDGFGLSVGQAGWRKLWMVKETNEKIIGHIDLRHYSEEYRFHRVMLGMGVDGSARKQGLGAKLIESVIKFCRESEGIEWLDLNVLSNNIPAKNLYLKYGFKVIGEMSDCYRIDGKSVSELTMTLCTKNYA
ncbi:GNAT family N-acetyltransferase [Photobacterium frigidiphilum]|uniref:GNAT family N-acetyltransferase n=1 Tax=Photobacterium frigidiphilum TaxID=264736 RepID=A0A2T3JM58_9GAMM|nr:GNAT family N-acetyltransferase [Photobacterium frigidiphilum]PSU50121.1 GNAT family N-acetyltransferase [Photobacterium frigidiphilum]